MITADFFFKVMRYQFIPWLGAVILVLGCCVMAIAIFGTALATLGFWAYVIPAVAMAIGIALIIGHLCSDYGTSNYKIAPKPQAQTSKYSPFKPKYRSTASMTRSANQHSLFAPKQPQRQGQPIQNTQAIALDDVIDLLHQRVIWGTSNYTAYLRSRLDLPEESSLFNLENLGNFHWVTQFENGETVDNPGQGDCFFYAFSLGLATEICVQKNEELFRRWCQDDPETQSWLDENHQFRTDSDTQRLITERRQLINDLAKASPYAKNKTFWYTCQRSLRRVLATNLKQELHLAIEQGVEPQNFFIDDYVKFIRNPAECNDGNFFVDIHYEPTEVEQQCEGPGFIALIHMSNPPTLENVKLLLAAMVQNPNQYNGLILYQNQHYYLDQNQQTIIPLPSKTENEQLNSLFYGCSLVKLSTDPHLLSKEETDQYIRSPYNILCYNDTLYFAQKAQNGMLNISQISLDFAYTLPHTEDNAVLLSSLHAGGDDLLTQTENPLEFLSERTQQLIKPPYSIVYYNHQFYRVQQAASGEYEVSRTSIAFVYTHLINKLKKSFSNIAVNSSRIAVNKDDELTLISALTGRKFKEVPMNHAIVAQNNAYPMIEQITGQICPGDTHRIKAVFVERFTQAPPQSSITRECIL